MSVNEQLEEASPSSWQNYLKIGLRWRWWFITSALVVWALALTASVVLPAKYKSETLVLIEPGDVPAQYVTSNIGLDLQQRLQSLTEQTLSRPRLAQLIDEFDLYGHKPGQPPSDAQVRGMRADIDVEVTRSTSRGEISAFKIAYLGLTAAQAQKVTTRLASLFIQDSVNRQQRVSENTTSFLEEQLKDAKENLQKQEYALRDIRSRNLGQLPEQRSANLQILSGLQDRLRSSTESLHQAEKQRLYLSSLLGFSAAATSGSGTAAQTTATPLDDQIEKMKSDLADLSTRYTPRHPDVIRLQEQIASAEKMRSELARTQSGSKAGSSLSPDATRASRVISPVSELQSQYKANEMEISSRKQEIKDLEKQVAEYQGRLNGAPIKEQEITDATRNYEQARTYYESLLSKKQNSEMVTDLSKSQTTAQFRTLDPPSLPQRPFSPNRLKFSAVGLALGMMIGLASIGVKEALDSRIYTEDDLSRWISVPVIATVPPLTTSSEDARKSRRRTVEFAVATVLLAMIPALTLLAYMKG